MSVDYNGTSSVSKSSASPVSATAFTMAAWVYSDTVSGLRFAFGIQNPSNDHGWRLGFNGTAVILTCTGTGGTQNTQVGAAAASGQWMHLGMVCSASNNRRIYKNGVNIGTGTASITPGSVNQIRIGAGTDSSGTAISFWDGRVAAVCLWNAGLTASEMAALGAGAFPLSIRSASVKSWHPLGGFYPHDVNDYWNGGYNLDSIPAASGQEPRIYHIGWSGFTTKSAVVNSYTLTCTTQDAAGTSNSAALKTARRLAGTTQTATGTVNVAGVNRTLTLACTTQSGAATSNSATVTAQRKIAGTTQDGAGTVNDSTLTTARTLAATTQTGSGTANNASLLAARALAGAAQDAAATSNDATLTKTRVLTCAVQSGSGTSNSATLAKASKLAATSRGGAGTANTATLGRVYSLVSTSLDATATPSDAQLRKSSLLAATVQAAIGTANAALLTTDQPERDYDIAPVTEFTSRKRRSILSGAARRASLSSRPLGTLETAADRATGFTAPQRKTLETD